MSESQKHTRHGVIQTRRADVLMQDLLSPKRIAITIIFAVASLVVASKKGVETGLYVTSAIVMLAVLLRVFLELVYSLICREPLSRNWLIKLIIGIVYPGLMIFFGKEQVAFFLVALSLLLAIGLVLIERVLDFINK